MFLHPRLYLIAPAPASFPSSPVFCHPSSSPCVPPPRASYRSCTPAPRGSSWRGCCTWRAARAPRASGCRISTSTRSRPCGWCTTPTTAASSPSQSSSSGSRMQVGAGLLSKCVCCAPQDNERDTILGLIALTHRAQMACRADAYQGLTPRDLASLHDLDWILSGTIVHSLRFGMSGRLFLRAICGLSSGV